MTAAFCSVCKFFSAAEDLQQKACGDRGADDAGDVRSHGVHQKEVRGVCLLSLDLADTRSHRDGADARGADERIDLAAGELIHQLADQQTADRGDGERHQTEHDDLDRLEREEARADRRCADGGRQQDRDDVHERILRGGAQPLGDAAE